MDYRKTHIFDAIITSVSTTTAGAITARTVTAMVTSATTGLVALADKYARIRLLPAGNFSSKQEEATRDFSLSLDPSPYALMIVTIYLLI
ncbi:uncharacterized protein YALI1_D05008g [Yarrowia lipolytica]|uniref:Uncharacterized protein n=1 Tax=Yarrowia lipolytica TaxID=4952 RepID=A0A1D8ND37_YARLL|nr:hypothetical protein YALI1_D05008g [Yarrowia lipolytica]